jgi:hypothetical protein
MSTLLTTAASRYRRLLAIAALCLLVLISGAAAKTVLTSDITLHPNKGLVKAGITLDFHSEDPAKPGRIPERVAKLVQIEPVHWDLSHYPHCPFTTGDAALAHGGCPQASLIGTGSIRAAVTTTPNASRAVGTVQFFNGLPVGSEIGRALWIVHFTTVQGDGPGALPPGISRDVAFETTFTQYDRSHVKTVTKIPDVHPIPGSSAEAVVTDLHLSIPNRGLRTNGPCVKRPHTAHPSMLFKRIATFENGVIDHRSISVPCRI